MKECKTEMHDDEVLTPVSTLDRLQRYVADKERGVKFDQDKLRYDLVPVYSLEQIVKVLTLGAKKYSDRNWELGMSWSRVFAALMRHSWSWFKGEDLDKETNISHLAHAACCCLFLLEYTRTKKELDDRPVGKIVTVVKEQPNV